MDLFCVVVVRLSLLLLTPLSDFASSLSTPHMDYLLTFSHSLNLLQSWLYIHCYRFTNKSLFLLSCCSFVIYVASLLIQLSYYKNRHQQTSFTGTLPSSIPNDFFSHSQTSFSSSMINNFTNSISNSISLSPAVTTLSKRSTDLLMFKIDDIFSPSLQTCQQQKPGNSILIISNDKQQNLTQDTHNLSNTNHNPTIISSLNSSKTSPIMATLLALSAPAPSHAAPINRSAAPTFQNYGADVVLNFFLATAINLMSLLLSSRSTPISFFKSFVSGVTWLLILVSEYIYASASQGKIILLFENKLLILLNTAIVVATIVFSAVSLFNKAYPKGRESDKIHSEEADNKPNTDRTFASYHATSDI